MNIPTSFKQRAMLIDEIWHASGDQSTDIDWYVKRTVLGGIYSTSEVYMVTDHSPGLFFSCYSAIFLQFIVLTCHCRSMQVWPTGHGLIDYDVQSSLLHCELGMPQKPSSLEDCRQPSFAFK